MAELLTGTSTTGKTRLPSSILQARLNVERALQLFRAKDPQRLPDCPGVVEGVLRGEKSVIWGVLSGIREMFPYTDQQCHTFFHLQNTGLPYAPQELRRLELSLLHWLRSLGLLPSRTPSLQPLTMLEIEGNIRNGTLLCDLAAILQPSKQPLSGVVKAPKTGGTAMANIRKALASFRTLPKMHHK